MIFHPDISFDLRPVHRAERMRQPAAALSSRPSPWPVAASRGPYFPAGTGSPAVPLWPLAGPLLCLPAFCSPPSSVQMSVPLGSLRRCCSTCEKSYLLVGSCSRLHIITLSDREKLKCFFILVKSFPFEMCVHYICRHLSCSLFISQIVLLHTVFPEK